MSGTGNTRNLVTDEHGSNTDERRGVGGTGARKVRKDGVGSFGAMEIELVRFLTRGGARCGSMARDNQSRGRGGSVNARRLSLTRVRKNVVGDLR